jgi:endonuclease YncB( thermonuclease family)
MLLRALLLFLAALVLRQWAVHPGLESDTLALADGADVARTLLAEGLAVVKWDDEKSKP